MSEAGLSDITEDFSDGLRFSARKSRGQLVDLNTGALRRGHVLVLRTPGIELFIGWGSGAGRALDFAFEGETHDDPFFAKCDAADNALKDGDLAKARQLGASGELVRISDSHLRRLALVETMIGKASVDDPVRPGWPAGTEGGLGGKFRPKDQSARAKETTEQELKRLNARREFRIAASAVLRLAVTAALNVVPGAGEVADVEELIELGRTAIELGNAEREVNAAIDFVKKGPYPDERTAKLLKTYELSVKTKFWAYDALGDIEAGNAAAMQTGVVVKALDAIPPGRRSALAALLDNPDVGVRVDAAADLKRVMRDRVIPILRKIHEEEMGSSVGFVAMQALWPDTGSEPPAGKEGAGKA